MPNRPHGGFVVVLKGKPCPGSFVQSKEVFTPPLRSTGEVSTICTTNMNVDFVVMAGQETHEVHRLGVLVEFSDGLISHRLLRGTQDIEGPGWNVSL